MRHLYFLITLFAFALCFLDSSAQITINEIVSSNNIGIEDDDEDHSDWIELYNSSNYEIDISGYLLSDRPEGKDFWAFPTATTIAAKGFITVFASDKNKVSSAQYTESDVDSGFTLPEKIMHTNFKIDSEGESLYLFSPDSQLIDTYPPIQLLSDVSYGRYPDGSDSMKYFHTPTPNKPNVNPSDKQISYKVIFSEKAGFYTKSIKVELSSESGNNDIYYTTDGSVPTLESTKYSGALTISKTTVLRAAIATDGNIGLSTTNSYIYNVNHTLPVVSICTDPDNLWDYYTGIYTKGPNAQPAEPYYGANFWMDWEKPANMEYFDESGNQQINHGAGLKIAGNYTRCNNHKALGLHARREYGSAKFNYQFFKDRNTDSYDDIKLRVSGNDWWYTMFRDGFITELVKEMDIDIVAFQPAVVYLNGEYWGIQNAREYANADHLASLYNVNEEDITIMENNSEVVTGNESDSYAELLSIVKSQSSLSDANYERISEIMDIDEYINYMLIEIYVHNDDWPGNNIKYWKSPNRKWRWILFDTDFGFGLYDSRKASYNTLTFATATNGPDWPNPSWSTLLFRQMLTNTTFKNKFINRYADCLNTVFLPSNVSAKVDSIKSIMSGEITRHIARWNGFTSNQWNSNVAALKTFGNQRPAYSRNHIRTFFGLPSQRNITVNTSDASAGNIQLNSLRLTSFPFSGIYFQTVPITLTAIPRYGYKFVRWEGVDEAMLNNASITINPVSNKSITAIFDVDNDAVAPAIIINEINFCSSNNFDSGDWVELYNGSDKTVDISNWSFEKLKYEYAIPSGTTIEPHEYIVLYVNKDKFQQCYPLVTNSVGEMSFSIGRDGEMLKLYSSTNELIDEVSFVNYAPWPAGAEATGCTIELTNPELDNNDGSNWRTSQYKGTPGQKNANFNRASLVSTKEQANCFPTSFVDFTTLKFSVDNAESYRIDIVDLSGQIRESITVVPQSDGIQSVDLFNDKSRNYGKGVYLVRLTCSSQSVPPITLKVVKK